MGSGRCATCPPTTTSPPPRPDTPAWTPTSPTTRTPSPGRITGLEAAAATTDSRELADQLWAHPIRALSDADLDRRLAYARDQHDTFALAGVIDTTTRHFAGLATLGERERARRRALPGEQAQAEAQLRQELDFAPPQRPEGGVAVGTQVDEAEATRQRAERDRGVDRGYGYEL